MDATGPIGLFSIAAAAIGVFCLWQAIRNWSWPYPRYMMLAVFCTMAMTVSFDFAKLPGYDTLATIVGGTFAGMALVLFVLSHRSRPKY